ncbi:MAG: beta-N-acetylhexosaminidase [Parabacteroides sp.]|nr:beta-N-acetylhexosaminidase [Parabacteroides sp.]
MNQLKTTLTGLCLLCIATLCYAGELRTIPAVQAIETGNGSWPVGNTVGISFPAALENEAEMLRLYLKEDFGIQAEQVPAHGTIRLILDPSFRPGKEDGYSIETEDTIRIKAASAAGIFYGIQTLRQLITRADGTCRIPRVTVRDYPAFPWRAFMLDEARAFKGKEVVKGLLDEMARLKLNVFHWHLTDDQGWRIEIKKYPELTRTGAWRDSTQLGGYRGTTFDGIRHGGYYTQEEIKEIIGYAAERHILIVPEFEMPGHESAAIASYPWLGTTGKEIKVPCRFGVQYEVMDVTSPEVRKFIEDVLDEIIALFPSPVIHIGGDEVKYDQWKASGKVQLYREQNAIETPADLQIVFTNSISHLLKQKGRRMMGWNDITGNKIHEYHSETDATAKHKLAAGTIVQFWKGDIQLVEQTARQGYDVVNSYHYMTYLDYDYKKIPLRQAYDFNPVPEGLPRELEPKILGLGCQMWGEEILSNARMYRMIFPRIAAYAESGWTLPAQKDYNAFIRALDKFATIWEAKGYAVYKPE